MKTISEVFSVLDAGEYTALVSILGKIAKGKKSNHI